MQIRPEQLQATVQKNVPPIIALSSEDSFLLQEAADTVRCAAREQGFLERQKFLGDRSFDWQELLLDAQSLSLFGDRKIIELSIPTGKPGDKGSKALLSYLELAPEDTILLILMGKVDASSMRSKWFKALDSQAAVCRIWPVNSRDLPRWISQRMQQKGLEAEQEAISLLSEKVEGNLMAAAQEIDKLVLSFGTTRVTTEDVLKSIGSSARYNVYELIEASLLGKADTALRMLHSLQAEGTNVLAVLQPFSNELRVIRAVQLANESGTPTQQTFKKLRVWQSRQSAIQAYLRRSNSQQVQALQRIAAKIDQTGKGAAEGNPWDELTRLIVELAGRKVET